MKYNTVNTIWKRPVPAVSCSTISHCAEWLNGSWQRFSNSKPTKKYAFLLVLQGEVGLFVHHIFFHEHWLCEFNMHSFICFTVHICRNILELQDFSRKLGLHYWKNKIVFTFWYSFVCFLCSMAMCPEFPFLKFIIYQNSLP